MLDYKYTSSVLLSPYISSLKEDFTKYIIEKQASGNESDLQISFEDYIKSQIHYNVLVYINNRNLPDYNSAYNYLCGRTDNIEAYKRVLRYYYEDVANLIFSLDMDRIQDFSIIGDNVIPRCDGIATVEIQLNQYQQDLESAYVQPGIENSDVDLALAMNTIPTAYSTKSDRRLVAEGSLLRYFAKIDGEISHITWR